MDSYSLKCMIEALAKVKAILHAEHKLNVQGDMLFVLRAFSPHHILNFMVLVKGNTSVGLWVWYGLIGKRLH